MFSAHVSLLEKGVRFIFSLTPIFPGWRDSRLSSRDICLRNLPPPFQDGVVQRHATLTLIFPICPLFSMRKEILL
jgi:hypothetical protein